MHAYAIYVLNAASLYSEKIRENQIFSAFKKLITKILITSWVQATLQVALQGENMFLVLDKVLLVKILFFWIFIAEAISCYRTKIPT